MDTIKLTVLYTYYGQKERIRGIMEEKHPESRIVIVDDCSQKPLKCPSGADCYRIDTDIQWNQPGAKNLGFQEADGWIVCADIDHLVTRENQDSILKMKKKKGTIYYLGREDTDSINLFLIHKEDFEKIGGYDEDFSGNYGYDDVEFLWRCQKNLNIVERRDVKAKVFAEESSSKMERDVEMNKELLKYKRHNEKNEGARIRFKWHKI